MQPMKRLLVPILMLAVFSIAQAEVAPATQPVTVVPVENDPPRHQQNLERIAQGPIGVAFFGDSITWGWVSVSDVWEQAFGQYHPANFGINGDRTQNLLWRMNHGELDGYKAKTIVLLVGTNNMGNPTKDIVLGVRTILQTIQEKQPQAKILLMAVFPRGHKTDKVRHEVQELNDELVKLADGEKVRFLDIGGHFLAEDGMIPDDLMYDLLHLTHKGYEIWANEMGPVLAEMMESKECNCQTKP